MDHFDARVAYWESELARINKRDDAFFKLFMWLAGVSTGGLLGSTFPTRLPYLVVPVMAATFAGGAFLLARNQRASDRIFREWRAALDEPPQSLSLDATPTNREKSP